MLRRLLDVFGLLLALYGAFVFVVGVIDGDFPQAAAGLFVAGLGASLAGEGME